MVESLLEALNKPRTLISFVKDRPGHDRRYALDPTLIETELGWQPRETWASGLRKTIEWYVANGQWIENTRNLAYQRLLPRPIRYRG